MATSPAPPSRWEKFKCQIFGHTAPEKTIKIDWHKYKYFGVPVKCSRCWERGSMFQRDGYLAGIYVEWRAGKVERVK